MLQIIFTRNFQVKIYTIICSLFNFKIQIDDVLSPSYWLFCVFSLVHRLSSYTVNKGSCLMMILLPLPCCSWFLHFLYRVAIHPCCDTSECLSRYQHETVHTHNMTWYPTQSHYLDTEPTSPYPILIMPSTWLESDKYQSYKSVVWLDQGSNPQFPTPEALALLIRPPRPAVWDIGPQWIIYAGDWASWYHHSLSSYLSNVSREFS